ncbi:MAG: MFS transporter [Acidimicrobiia bacterium]|nr:MFS transporter [Acidimicrobiia bacterium]
MPNRHPRVVDEVSTWRGNRSHVIYTVAVFILLASLDNTALAMIPAMVKPVSSELGVSEVAIGFMTATVVLITALTAVVWGFQGDRSNRKVLLLVGTAVWSGGTALSATAGSYGTLFGYQLITAVGLGSIASVGFSMVSDLIRPGRRGLVMSFWGISQGLGTLGGGLLASQLGAGDFRQPLMAVAIAGLGCAVLYIPAFNPPRGFREPELEGTAIGDDHVIDRSQVPALMRKPTNRWLILQGFTAQFAYGSLIWATFLYQSKVEAAGYSEATATKVGGLFVAIFQVGALMSIVAGHIGDRLQERTPRGRALLSAAGILGAIPFFMVFFFVPLRGLDVTEGAGTGQLIPEVLRELATNPWAATAFVSAILAIALTSADSPNWFALISDVNLPEHRGTVYGLGNLTNGVGRAIGNGMTGPAAVGLSASMPPPWNWATGLALFQVFFLPTGYCYWKAAETSADDIADVRSTLRARAGG